MAIRVRHAAIARRNLPDITARSHAADWPELAGIVAVLFASRSGSTALCRHAERHFAVGQVLEALNGNHLRHHQTDCRTSGTMIDPGLTDGLKWQIERNSPDGWYMFKTGTEGLANAERIGFLSHYRKQIRPVLLIRRDIIGQALSGVIAERTQRFHSTSPVGYDLRPEDYDAAAIARYIRHVVDTNHFLEWRLRQFRYPATAIFHEAFQNGDMQDIDRALIASGLPQRSTPQQNPRRGVMRMTHPLTDEFRARFTAQLPASVHRLLATHQRFIARWS